MGDGDDGVFLALEEQTVPVVVLDDDDDDDTFVACSCCCFVGVMDLAFLGLDDFL